MGKNTPRARAVRTFIATLASFAVVWATIDWWRDWRAGAALVGVNVANSALAGAAAYFLARAKWVANTPLGKAFATFCQIFGTGMSQLLIVDFFRESLVNFGRGVVTTTTAAVIAAILSGAQNASEDLGGGVPPPG